MPIRVMGNGMVDRDTKHITPADIIASINYFFNLLHGVNES